MKDCIRSLSSEERKQYFLKKTFEVSIVKKEGQFFGYIKELGITHKASTLQAVYDGVNEKKESYINDIIEMEIEDLIMGDAFKLPKMNNLWTNFLLKTLLFTIIFVGPISLSLNSFANKMTYQFDRIDHRLEEALNPSEEKSKERLDRFQATLEKLKPYLLEIKKALKE